MICFYFVALSNDIFDRAFAEFQKFGMQRSIPIEQRWSAGLPELDSRDYSAAIARCEVIEAAALALAEHFRASQISMNSAFAALSQQFPDLTPERIEISWNQAMYFSLRS